jgi:hypothetical protein
MTTVVPRATVLAAFGVLVLAGSVASAQDRVEAETSAAERSASSAAQASRQPTEHLVAADLAGIALAQRLAPHGTYCDGFTTCSTGAGVPGGMVAVRVVNGWLAVSIEFSLSSQARRSRFHPLYDEEFALRTTRGSLLAGYRFPPRRGVSFSLLGGMSETVVDAEGAFRIRGALEPLGGRYPFADRKWALGVTGGGDAVVELGARWSIVIPARVTWTVEDRLPETWPSRIDVEVGAGLSLRLFQRTR